MSMTPIRSRLPGFLLAVITFISAMFVPLLSAEARTYTQGENYKILDGMPSLYQAGGKVKVVEMFWYGCPHCNKVVSPVKRFVKSHKKTVNFNYMALPSGSGRNPWYLHARLFYTYRALGMVDAAHALTFRLIHKEHKSMLDPAKAYDELAKKGIFKALHIKKPLFVKTFNSKLVDKDIEKGKAMAQQFQVQGTPTFIIDGRIVASIGGLRSHEEIADLLSYLVKQVRKGRI